MVILTRTFKEEGWYAGPSVDILYAEAFNLLGCCSCQALYLLIRGCHGCLHSAHRGVSTEIKGMVDSCVKRNTKLDRHLVAVAIELKLLDTEALAALNEGGASTVDVQRETLRKGCEGPRIEGEHAWGGEHELLQPTGGLDPLAELHEHTGLRNFRRYQRCSDVMEFVLMKSQLHKLSRGTSSFQ